MQGRASEVCEFTAPLICRYSLHVPPAIGAGTVAVLALHGYGSNAAAMLRLAIRLAGEEHLIAALEAPHPFYVKPDDFQSEVGYGWGTRNHMEAAAELHHKMVLRALAQLQERFGIGSRRTLLMGFSQPVSLNYRFAAANPGAVGGLLSICGGIPSGWRESAPPKLDCAVLYIARSEDQYYPPEAARQFAGRLELAAPDVEFHLLPGPHRIPSLAGPIVQPWIERIYRTRKPAAEPHAAPVR